MSIARRTITTLAAAALLVAAGFLSACTPEEVKLFQSLSPAEQQSVADQLFPATGCVEAMHRVWPQSEWAWAERIMWRESNHTPSARNSSGASGCWQMMLPLHSGIFRSVGCSPADWANALCNNRAAYALFQQAGRSPWVLTNY